MQVKRTLKNFSEDNLALPANHLESVLFDDDLFGDRKLFVITPLSIFEFFIMNYDAKVECFFNFGCVWDYEENEYYLSYSSQNK